MYHFVSRIALSDSAVFTSTNTYEYLVQGKGATVKVFQHALLLGHSKSTSIVEYRESIPNSTLLHLFNELAHLFLLVAHEYPDGVEGSRLSGNHD